MITETSGAWPPGFRIMPRGSGPSPEWLERYRGIPTSWVSDAMGRCVGTYGIRPYHSDLNAIICGPAFTVRVRPGDNLMIHKAMELAAEGDVLVIDGGADVSQALLGGNMMTTAVFKKFAGFIIDGAIRDICDWATNVMPIWARGHTHRGPTKDGPGEINVSVAIAGMPVSPGDLVIADADGVLAIPVSRLEAIWPEVEKQQQKEERTRKANAVKLPDPERFDSILRAKGCPV